MDRHHRIHMLPVELLSQAFDSLPLESLLDASRVSAFWREVAFRHPTFWRDVALTSLRPAAISLYLARLGASSDQSITITVSLDNMPFPEPQRAVVLPSIARNMHRIDALYLDADLDCDTDIFETLRLPAPRLVALDLCLLHETRTSDAMPVDLFGGHAPRLRSVQLLNVQLRADRLPPALSNVKELRYLCYKELLFPIAVFTHCAALEDLSIWGKNCSLFTDNEESSLASSANTRALRSLDMSVPSGSFRLFQKIPCASIPHIAMPLVDVESADMLLAHLYGKLHVKLRCLPLETYVKYSVPTTGMTRTFHGRPYEATSETLPRAYVTDDLLSRVESLDATSDCTDLLLAFAYLPSCTHVTLGMSDDGTLPMMLGPLYAPQLLHIGISCLGGASVRVGDLLGFLDNAFLTMPRVVNVVLEGIHVDGDISVVPCNRFTVTST